LSGSELIDRLQNIAGHVADRQYLNSRRPRPGINRSRETTTPCPEIKLTPPFSAISAASVVIALFIFIYLLHISHLFLRERRDKVSKKFEKFLGHRLGTFYGTAGFVALPVAAIVALLDFLPFA
jgi:hypothetical protein